MAQLRYSLGCVVIGNDIYSLEINDRTAICGSANVNDRSLLGEGDSKFCVVINDTETVEEQFNGELVHVEMFCRS